jgi:hypothetical protein
MGVPASLTTGTALIPIVEREPIDVGDPHNGKEADFQLFMGLLDADRFEGRFREGIHKADVSGMTRRLIKEEPYHFDGTPLFPERHAYTGSYSLSPAQ